MFGYIRPLHAELLVREYELYRAVYCGLCRYGGKHISHFTRFFLNYDFVALALLRLSLTNEQPHIERKRCPYHAKKRNTLGADKAFGLTCSAFAVLLYYKVCDDIKDSSGIKKLVKRAAKPFFSRIKKRAKGYGELEEHISGGLARLEKAERDGEANPDASADCFAEIVGGIASYGLDGKKRHIAAQCGYHIGRYIYLLDALDDIYGDESSGCYNPLLKKYGSADSVFDNIGAIKTTVTDSLNAFSSVYGLVTVEGCEDRIKDYDNIIFNISELGGRNALEKVHQALIKKRQTEAECDGSL